MNTTLIPAKALSAEHIAAWANLQRADCSFRSPFFRPEFTQAVAAVRDDVEVAVLEQDGQPVGFLPFQRSCGNVGRPVGGRLSDFQGVVLKAGVEFDPLRLIRECRLSALHFDHLIVAQKSLSPFHWTRECSPYIDLSSGFDAYLEQRYASAAVEVMQTLRKKRKSERQAGPIRVELRTTDTHVLETLIEWKTRQYCRSQTMSLFTFPWTVALLERLLHMPETAEFTGMLSALYFGNRLAAAHFGMRAGGVVHWWFPAYDVELRKYSPGSQLILEVAKAAGSIGVDRIDLGKGPELYKRSFMSGATQVAEGSVDRRPTTRTLRRWWQRTHRWVRESPLRGPATVPWRWIKRLRDQLEYR